MNAQTTVTTLSTEAQAAIAKLSDTYATRKVTGDDIETAMNSDVAFDLAHEYVTTYTGTFPFILNMQSWLNSGCTMTDAQAAGVLNAAISDYRYAQKRAAVQTAQEIVAQPATRTYDHSKQYVADGWYTIVGPQGGHRTLRLTTVQVTERGGDGVTQWLAYLSGSDNVGDYQTVGFVKGNEVTLFKKNTGKYADIVAAARFLVKNAENIGEYGRQYALRSGKCYVCNRKLTTPESIAAGIGPVCASK